jgi:hypothetical protein
LLLNLSVIEAGEQEKDGNNFSHHQYNHESRRFKGFFRGIPYE